MKMIGEKVDNGLLSNTRSLKYRGSGLKSVCNKNTPSAGIKSNANLKEDSFMKMKSKTLTVSPQQSSKNYEQPNEFVITLFEKCFRPTTQTFRQTSQESDELDSRVILMINKTKPEGYNSKNRPKSQSIKIGGKAQKYRQNNKSEPKKVYDFNTLSARNIKHPSQINKQLTPNERQYMKKTLLKSSPKIFMTKKNSPQFVELCSKLKSFEEDMKKTKKPIVLALDLNPTNVVECEQNVNKNYVSLKNHQLLPKSQPLSSQNILVLPQSQQQQNCQQLSDDKETVCRISRNQVFSKDSFQGLEKTKKMGNYALQSQQIIASENIQQQLQDKAPRRLSVDSKIDDFTQFLIPNQQLKYVLSRFKQNRQQQQQPRKQQQSTISLAVIPIHPSSIQHLNVSIPEMSCLNSHQRGGFNSNNDQVEMLSYREMESVSFDFKESKTLRDTDYGNRLGREHNVQSPVSEGRKSLRNSKPKQTIAQSKLRCLDQGAKTIVTKYDSSDKRSIVQQSIILFHGSKDMKPSYSRQPQDFKPSFSRQLLNDYASRYRGSLGVDAFINQSYQQEFQGNNRNQHQHVNIGSNQTSFDKILVSPNPSISRFKKAYSIRQADNYF